MPTTNEKQKVRPPRRKPLWHYENLCSYCLYFDEQKPSGRTQKGNCAYHKEWIDNASSTTCSDMSSHSLVPPGIYRLSSEADGPPTYVRRKAKVRTRLFLVKNQNEGEGERK